MSAIKLGHVVLKVRDPDQSLAFYGDLLGLKLSDRLGDDMAFLTGSESHHELALMRLGSGAEAPSRRAVGLLHTAFEVADQRALANAYLHLTAAGHRLGLTDHLISWSIYLNDPDGNGVELYWDTRHRLPAGKQPVEISRPLLASRLLSVLQPEQAAG